MGKRIERVLAYILFLPIIVPFLSCVVLEPKYVMAQASGIVISVVGDFIKIRGYRNYQVSVTAYLANVINKRTLNSIRSGALNEITSDPIPWIPGSGRQIVESELALQWGIVEYLERKIPRTDNQKGRILKTLKESLLSTTEFLEAAKKPGARGVVDKKYYDILLLRRKHLNDLLRPY